MVCVDDLPGCEACTVVSGRRLSPPLLTVLNVIFMFDCCLLKQSW